MTAAICVAVALGMILIPCCLVAVMDAVSQRRRVRELEVENAWLVESSRARVDAESWYRERIEAGITDQASVRARLEELVRDLVTAKVTEPEPAQVDLETGMEHVDLDGLVDWTDAYVPPVGARVPMPDFEVDE